MHWMFTGLLIAVSVGIAGFTGHLLRRLFTTTTAATTAPHHDEAQ